MKCAGSVSVVLVLFAATNLLVTSSDAARPSRNGEAASTLHRIADVAAVVLSRLGCTVSRTKVPQLILEADMNNYGKWHAAVLSQDSSTLEGMLRLCKNREEKYVCQMYEALTTACSEKRCNNVTKIIKAMCMDLDRFKHDISYYINEALRGKDGPCLVATLDGITEKMDQMPETIGRVLATILIFESSTYPGSAEKIHTHVTHAGVKELSLIARIESQEGRLAALDACFKRRNDWPQGFIEEVAEVTLEEAKYHFLELSLRMEPSNKDYLRRQAMGHLWESILFSNSDEVDVLIRVFDMSIAEVDNSLRYAIKTCVIGGTIKELKNLFDFLNSKPQRYRLTVDAALKEVTQEMISLFDNESQKCYRMLQNWTTATEPCQEEDESLDRCNTQVHIHGYARMASLLVSRICNT